MFISIFPYFGRPSLWIGTPILVPDTWAKSSIAHVPLDGDPYSTEIETKELGAAVSRTEASRKPVQIPET